MLSALQLGRNRDCIARTMRPRDGFREAVGCLRERVIKIGSAGESFGQIRESYMKAFAVLLGRKTGGVGGRENYRSSRRIPSCCEVGVRHALHIQLNRCSTGMKTILGKSKRTG